MQLVDNKTVLLTAQFLDGLGGGVEPVEPCVWASSDLNIVTVEGTDDQASAVAVPGARLGHAVVTCTSGALSQTFDIEVVSGAPQSVAALYGVPEPMTEAQSQKQETAKAALPPEPPPEARHPARHAPANDKRAHSN